MRQSILLLSALLALAGCKDEKTNKADEPVQDTVVTPPSEEATAAPAALTFANAHYERKTQMPCSDPCANIKIDVPAASGPQPAADSINKKIFNVVRSIVVFGEKPYQAKDYNELAKAFIKSYDDLKKQFPQDKMGWEGTIKGTVDYQSAQLLQVKINHYLYTAGAHGYEGNRALLFDKETGKSLGVKDIISDTRAFTALAEKKFRQKFKIPAGKPINSTGLMFENEKFALPQTMFLRKDGILLYYNTYEIASYAEQQKELLIPHSEAGKYLKVK